LLLSITLLLLVTEKAIPGQEESLAIAAMKRLIEGHGKGNPLRLPLERLATLYSQSYGNFSALGLGKLKKFVGKHFHYREESQEVWCKADHKRKKRKKQQEQGGDSKLTQCMDPVDDGGYLGTSHLSVSMDQPLAMAESRVAVSVDDPKMKAQGTGTVTELAKNLEVLDSLADLKVQLDSVSKEMLTKEDVDQLCVARLLKDLKLHPKKVREIEGEAESELPKWCEWKMLKQECKSFDKFKAQFFLIAGVVPESEAQYIGLLRKVKWHAIIDLDPNSESSGLHKAFTLDEDKQSLYDLWAPNRILDIKSSELAEEINWLRSPWLFARGRTNDTSVNQPRKSFEQWRADWKSPIALFLTILAERLAELVPIVTLILPFDGDNNVYMSALLTCLDQYLSSRRGCSAKHVILNTRLEPTTDSLDLAEVTCPKKSYRLPSSLFSFGLRVCLGYASQNAKLMPTSVAEVDAPITESDILYLSEFLTLLYKGCENEYPCGNPDAVSDEQRRQLIEEHKEAFLSGQTISFISLHHDHDATRDDLQRFRSNIQRHMDQRPMPPSTVINLVHQPGTGGSTLARRTLWELRVQFPCAIIKSSLKVHTPEEEVSFTFDVCRRILALEDICCVAPLVLLDGVTSVFRRSLLSRAITDRLKCWGSKAVIVHCLRGTGTSECPVTSSPYSIALDTKLSFAEQERFREKYGQRTSADVKVTGLSRTFHFPLCAFVKQFKKKMEEIVKSTLVGLDKTETGVIRFVALMQVYAGQSVPMSLILKLFLDERQIRGRLYSIDDEIDSERLLTSTPSYEEIYGSFSDSLRVLLVHSSPRIRWQADVTCDLQHRVVAECVLREHLGESRQYYGRLEKYLKELLSLVKEQRIDAKYVPLFEDLFMHNQYTTGSSFSVIIETLKKHLLPNERVGRLLRQAADVFPSVKFYSHVARYFAYCQPHKYDLAEEMIVAGFAASKPRESKAILHEMRGLACRIKLAELVETGAISTLEDLERLASNSIQEYTRATTNPPSKPNPLLGKVQVWLKCLDWISKNKCDGIANIIRYLGTETPEFFRNILSESFYHLDVIEQILATHTVYDKEYVQDKVIECKANLCFVQAKSGQSGRFSRHPRLVQELEKLSKGPKLAQYSDKEVRHLTARLLSYDTYGMKIESMKRREIEYLYRLYRDLVAIDKEYQLTSRLIRVAMCLPPEICLSLDQALEFVQCWQTSSPRDPYPYFYSFVLYFLKVLEGGAVEYGAKYERSLEKCKELSSSCINTTKSIFYLGKGGPGLSALTDRSALKNSKSHDFWRQKSRETLMELEGRVKAKRNHRRKSAVNPGIYLEMKSGIKIDVGRNQMQLEGDLGRDYHVDQLVKFVVSFCLLGPFAHGFVV
jgi:hypothetical protein